MALGWNFVLIDGGYVTRTAHRPTEVESLVGTEPLTTAVGGPFFRARKFSPGAARFMQHDRFLAALWKLGLP